MSFSDSTFTRLGYGRFPYFIIREEAGLFRQVPIHFTRKELKYMDGVYVSIKTEHTYAIIRKKCIQTLKQLIDGDKEPISHRIDKAKIYQMGKQRKQGCIVFGPNEAIYLDCMGKVIKRSKAIPFGGNLISICNNSISLGGKHYNIY